MRLNCQSNPYPALERQETGAGIPRADRPLLPNVFPNQFPRLEALPIPSVIYQSHLKQRPEAAAEPPYLPIFKNTAHRLRNLKVRNQKLLRLVGKLPNPRIQEL